MRIAWRLFAAISVLALGAAVPLGLARHDLARVPNAIATPVVEVRCAVSAGGTVRVPLGKPLPWSRAVRFDSTCDCTSLISAQAGVDGDGFVVVDLKKEPEVSREFAPSVRAFDAAGVELFRVNVVVDLSPIVARVIQ